MTIVQNSAISLTMKRYLYEPIRRDISKKMIFLIGPRQIGKMMLVIVIAFMLTGCTLFKSPSSASSPSVLPAIKSQISPTVHVSKENLSMAKTLKQYRPSEYILGSDDSIEIQVLGHDDMKMSATISPTGKIQCYTGNIHVAGLTQFELKDILQKEISRLVKDPLVVVRITEYRSHKLFILGQVKNPGVFPVRGDVTLLEAISMAGGVTSDAYLNGAFLVRDGKILLINFLNLLTRGNMEENVPLLANDIVYIPDRRDQKVYVLGEVNRQSAIPLSDRMTLLQAITEAGGFSTDANTGSVLLVRGNLSEPEIMVIDAMSLFKKSAGKGTKDVDLRQGDIIYVTSSTFAKIGRTAVRVSQILDPFLQVLRGVILSDTAIGILTGEENKKTTIVIPD